MLSDLEFLALYHFCFYCLVTVFVDIAEIQQCVLNISTSSMLSYAKFLVKYFGFALYICCCLYSRFAILPLGLY